jgi:membrane-bound lytic murein transglycosylase D
MPVRASNLLAAILAATLLTPAVGLAAPVGLVLATVAPDSGVPSVTDRLASARAAYEAAWTQRQAGDPLACIRTTEAALLDVDGAMATSPDATTLRDLTEMRSKLAGLRDAARGELSSVGPAVEPGNEADDKVLNAPAVDAIQPQLNADVHRWIEFFSGAGRSTFEKWLKRSGRYMDLFRSVLQKEGLPPDLVHLVFVESGFNVNARSVSAAVGPWQFLRGTARYFGLTVDQWVDERKDPEKATVAAARYLKHLHSIFGDWPLALASYNAGEGTVLRAIKAQGTTNYWDLRLPKQTEDYVPQFMAALVITRDPVKYGFDAVELDDPMAFDEIALKGAVDLRTVAKLAECSYEELRDLNPAVLRGAAASRSGVTTLRVPQGKGEILLKKLQDGAPLPAVNLTLKHKVKRKETLQSIASQYTVSAKEIARINGIGKKRPLRRGMMLTVPASLHAAKPTLAEPDDPRASTDYVPVKKIGLPASLVGSSTADGRVNVTVKKGETLQMIADRHGVSVDDIRRWNRLKTSTVRRGTRLKIRTGIAAIESKDSTTAQQIAKLAPPRRSGSARRAASGTVIRVRPGDTLSSIAERHGVSLMALKKANGNSSRIRAGQRLRIPRS